MATQTAPLSLRERNKRRKEDAIRSAARELFEERGFEATTLREVAIRADVGFGTLYAYAVDKVGLLAMVYVAELRALPSLFDDRNPKAAPLDQLSAALAKLFRYWATIPKLSNHVLEHIEFYGGSPHMDAIVERRQQARDEIKRWVSDLQADGTLNGFASAEITADTLFAIYTSVVREWSVNTPVEPELGIERFRRLAALPIGALSTSAGVGPQRRPEPSRTSIRG